MGARSKVRMASLILSIASSLASAGALGQSTAEKAGDAVGHAAEKAGRDLTDAAVTGHIQEQFLLDELVKGRNIKVTTNRHEVTLRGVVQSQGALERALSIARHTQGVASVTNLLQIDPLVH